MTTLKSRLASPSRSQIPPRLAATWTWMTPVYLGAKSTQPAAPSRSAARMPSPQASSQRRWRSEEHTSELQSLRHLVCRLLLEKKNKNKTNKKLQKKQKSKANINKT